MKKIIGKKEYNTENATIIKKVTFSYFGDPAGYEQTLCQTPDGLYFVYVCGGETSPYPCEEITRISKNKVSEWIENH